ncbi:HNH endonuclease [Shewanella sp. DAU305]|uniref:HNH endonuclease n=1 Tax=Shewanella sp. DAU305 TaxID=2991940 RepID=UPI002283810C|nr:HNH endonuclease [Shewanella sp. DAU305]WAL79568.1 HNH endonuclease [Shewanella sp. DAU305]
MLQWKRTKAVRGQKPRYSFEEIRDSTLRVIRDNDGEIFVRDFSIGDRFITYAGLKVEMESLNPDGGSEESGYYIIVREVTSSGTGKKTDISAQNQIDKLYFGQEDNEEFKSPHEVDDGEVYTEGAVKQVVVNKYERDPKARKACIARYGCKCNVCGFDFSDRYGKNGEGFIEVHHIKPLNEIKGSYQVDPINDLIPVCSNCHSMLHRGKEPLSIEELKALVTRN